MLQTKKKIVNLLLNHPVSFAISIGFTKLTDIHNEWLRKMIQSDHDETLQAHRGSYKTTCVSVALAIIIVAFPNDRTAFVRKTDGDVKEVIAQVKKILKHPIMQEISVRLWGVQIYFTKDSATEVTTNLTNDIKGSSQLVGFGIGTSITGKHYDRIFTDDIVNVSDRTSKADREQTKIIYQELQNVKNRGGHIFNTGTPWHEDDCFSIMPEPSKYDCYSTGLMTDEDIDALKSRMTASLFASNYELRHIAAEDIIFANPVKNADPSLIEQARFCHIDASYGGEDYTAFTIAKKMNDKYYVFGKMWSKHVDDCLEEITAYVDGFMAGKIWCEDNGDKGYLAKELKRKGQRAVTYHESTNKFLKITTYLKAIWKDVEFITGTDESYISQILDYNENADHDDAPDSLASMARLLYDRRNENEQVASFMM